MTRTVFLDWYNTLSTSIYWGHLAASNPIVHSVLRSALFDTNARLLVPWMRGRLATEQVLAQVAAAAQLDPAWVLREFIAGCQCMALVSPEVPRLVGQLRQAGVRVLIATDNMDAFNRWTLPALNLTTVFDGVLNSCDLGVMKDDLDPAGRSLFFGPYLAHHDLAPNQCCLVDDSPDTVAVTQALGMRYHRVHQPEDVVKILAAIARDTSLGRAGQRL